MTFPEALAAVFDDGKRITRRFWNNRQVYLQLDYHKQLCTTWNSATNSWDGLMHPLIITEEDYFADDWETVDA